jgi:DNA replication protein DnaC
MRRTHRAGEKMFIDYAGQTVPIVNPTTGEIIQAQIFVAVLGASNYTFAEATFTQQLHDWIGSHVRAFEFFDGVTQLIIPDNLKSGVTQADRYEPLINRSYQEMLTITGPTGTGKSWLACAFGHAAYRQGLSVRYQRTGRLLDELRIARGDASYSKLLRQLAKLDLLILDDFGLKPLAQNERHDLLEVIEDRHGSHSAIITSQLPIGSWHDYLNDPTVADALLDRLLANAHRLELKGVSFRKTR